MKKTTKKVENKPLSPAQIRQIIALDKKGLSQRAIAKKVGCSRSGVWYRLQK